MFSNDGNQLQILSDITRSEGERIRIGNAIVSVDDIGPELMDALVVTKKTLLRILPGTIVDFRFSTDTELSEFRTAGTAHLTIRLGSIAELEDFNLVDSAGGAVVTQEADQNARMKHAVTQFIKMFFAEHGLEVESRTMGLRQTHNLPDRLVKLIKSQIEQSDGQRWIGDQGYGVVLTYLSQVFNALSIDFDSITIQQLKDMQKDGIDLELSLNFRIQTQDKVGSELSQALDLIGKGFEVEAFLPVMSILEDGRALTIMPVREYFTPEDSLSMLGDHPMIITVLNLLQRLYAAGLKFESHYIIDNLVFSRPNPFTVVPLIRFEHADIITQNIVPLLTIKSALKGIQRVPDVADAPEAIREVTEKLDYTNEDITYVVRQIRNLFDATIGDAAAHQVNQYILGTVDEDTPEAMAVSINAAKHVYEKLVLEPGSKGQDWRQNIIDTLNQFLSTLKAVGIEFVARYEIQDQDHPVLIIYTNAPAEQNRIQLSLINPEIHTIGAKLTKIQPEIVKELLQYMTEVGTQLISDLMEAQERMNNQDES